MSRDPRARLQRADEAVPRPESDGEARLRRTIEADLIPRLAVSHRAGFLPPELGSAVGRILDEREVEEFVRVVRGMSEGALDEYIGALIDAGTTPEAIYVDLMAPAARRLGVLWEEDACSFMDVTLSLGRMQRVLRSLQGLFLASAGAHEEVGRVLLCGLEDEQHSLGLIIVAEFFVRAGWSVQVGAPGIEADPVARLGEEWYDTVGFSLGCRENLPRLSAEVRRARAVSRNRDLTVLVGGPAFEGSPELVRQVGADAAASDARAAVEAAERFL